MKLSGRQAAGYPQNPDPQRPALLLYGADPVRVGARRDAAALALAGPAAAAEMRLDRIGAAELRATPSALADALRATGFFPGPRVVLADGLGDGATAAVTAALADWQPGDAVLIVTAGALPARSKLRKLFEGHDQAVAAPVYDDPPDRAEIARALAAEGLDPVPSDAAESLEALAEALDPGSFAQLLTTLALYKRGDATPLAPQDIAALAPLSVEAGVDAALEATATGRADRLGPLLQRLAARGTDPVSLAIAAGQHFRALHAAASHPSGPGAGLAALRPPVFGPRRSAMERQARAWGQARLETALAVLVDTDLALRSGGATAPPAALIARALFRLAFLAPR